MYKEIRFYRLKNGITPVADWLESLRDVTGRVHITNRINRIALGNYGDYKFLGDGGYELRIHYGPGY